MKNKERKELINRFRELVIANKKFMMDIEVSLRNLRTLMVGGRCSELYVIDLDKIIERLSDSRE